MIGQIINFESSARVKTAVEKTAMLLFEPSQQLI